MVQQLYVGIKPASSATPTKQQDEGMYNTVHLPVNVCTKVKRRKKILNYMEMYVP